jgi:Lon protease-like protein
MSPVLADLPLFALNTVLFPDGLLPLRVFEPRYLDMVRDCLRDGASFGVCLLKSGREVATADETPTPEPVGCLAEIIECDVEQIGILALRTRGSQRFRLLSTRVEANGLMLGMAEPIPPDPAVEGTAHLAKQAACAEVLERIIETLSGRDPQSLPFIEPFRLDDASWVSNRLAEVLPIPVRARQKLMEIEDATARLDIVHRYMVQHQML